MVIQIISSLIYNASLLVALGILYTTFSPERGLASRRRQVYAGVFIGAIGVAVMLSPWNLAPGVLLDTRTILLSVAGLFFGPAPTLIAVVMAGAIRLVLGGAGVWAGLAMIVTSAALGLLWGHSRRSQKKLFRWGELYFFGLATHIVMLLCMFLLPQGIAGEVLRAIALPVLAVYPLATVLLGTLLTYEFRRMELEETIRQSESRFRKLVEQGDDIIAQISAQGDFLQVSDSVTRLLGYDAASLVGTKVQPLLHPEDASAVISALSAELVTPAITRRLEARVRHRDGHWVWMEAAVTNLLHDPRVGALVANAHDISDRRQAQEDRLDMERRMLHMQRLESLGVLAGGIAHDFNNLLMGVLGNLELALSDMPMLSAARPSVEKATLAAKRAAGLTRQMLAYSGKGRFAVGEIDLTALVRENVHILRSAASSHVTLDLRLSEHLPPILADGGQLQQVAMNLVTNASEAIGERAGVVTLSTGAGDYDAAYLSRSRTVEKPPPGRFAWLDVADTGCGMDAPTQERLFDPFFTTKFTGRGLGMSVVLGIVSGHKGAILVDSTVGAGTTVRVLFPAAEAAAPAHETEPADRSAGDASATPKMLGAALLADDDEMVRDLGMRMLRSLGFQALGAGDGVEALQLFGEHADEIRAVILDLTMPRLDGVAALAALRAIKPDVPVILCSGYSEQEATRRFAGQGLAGFLQKPYAVEDLRAAVRAALAGAESAGLSG